MKEQKKSLPLALLFSFLVCLLGAIVWGLVYSIGFFVAIISAVTVMCAIMVYQKFYKVNWLTYLWVIIWVVLLNEISMLITLTIMLMNEVGGAYSFGECFNALTQAINDGGEMTSAFTSDSIMNVVFSLLGGVLEIFTIRSQMKRKRELEGSTLNDVTIQPNQQQLENSEPQKESKKQTKTLAHDDLEKTYVDIVNSCKVLVELFNSNKDKEKFKQNLTDFDA